METQVVPMAKHVASAKIIAHLVQLRTLSAEDFIDRHASGTLRKNKKVGMKHRSQYLHERAAYEYGYGFECLPASRVTIGEAQTEGDCKPLTEVGWHCERFFERMLFPEDKAIIAYITVEEEGGKRREGVGLVMTHTSAPWVPHHHVVFAIIAEVDLKTHTYLPAVNPF